MSEEYEEEISEVREAMKNRETQDRLDNTQKALLTSAFMEKNIDTSFEGRLRLLMWQLMLVTVETPEMIPVVSHIFSSFTKLSEEEVRDNLTTVLKQNDNVLLEWDIPPGMRARITTDFVLAYLTTGMKPVVQVHRVLGKSEGKKPKKKEINAYFDDFYGKLDNDALCAPVPVHRRDSEAIGVTMYCITPSQKPDL